MSLTARAAGTDMTGGPLSESIIIDFLRHFNRVKKIGGSATVVQPGVYYRDLEKQLQKRGLLLPSYPASKDSCALGGMVANNAGGEKTLAYGKTADYVKELKVVLSDGNEYLFKPLRRRALAAKLKQNNFEGEIYRKIRALIVGNRAIIKSARPDVSKNSSGYALWNVWQGDVFNLIPLFVGSQGTLGLITEIKLKLIKSKKHSRLLVIFINDLKLLALVVRRVLRFKPESFELFDDRILKLGMRFLFWRFFWRFLPEIGLLIKNGFRLPRLVLMAEFAGNSPPALEKQVAAVQADLKRFNLPSRATRDAGDTQKYWTIRRESFNWLRRAGRGKKAAPFIDDLIVRPERLPEFIPRLEKILRRYGRRIDIDYTIAGHVGDGNLHIIPLVDLDDKKTKALIPAIMKEVYDLVFEFGGSMSAEHNDGLLRTPFVRQMFGSRVYRLFQETKQIFDPDGIFNPGKKVTDFLRPPRRRGELENRHPELVSGSPPSS